MIEESDNLRERIEDLLKEIEDTYKQVASSGFPAYHIDVLVMSVIKRVKTTSSGILLLLDSKNMMCSKVLLRTLLDSSMRFSALFLTKDFSKSAVDIYEGTKNIRQLRSRDNQKLTDRYIVNEFSKSFPHLKVMYEELNDYVHLSKSHIEATFSDITDINTADLSEIETFENYEKEWVEANIAYCLYFLLWYIDEFSRIKEVWIARWKGKDVKIRSKNGNIMARAGTLHFYFITPDRPQVSVMVVK